MVEVVFSVLVGSRNHLCAMVNVVTLFLFQG